MRQIKCNKVLNGCIKTAAFMISQRLPKELVNLVM